MDGEQRRYILHHRSSRWKWQFIQIPFNGHYLCDWRLEMWTVLYCSCQWHRFHLQQQQQSGGGFCDRYCRSEDWSHCCVTRNTKDGSKHLNHCRSSLNLHSARGNLCGCKQKSDYVKTDCSAHLLFIIYDLRNHITIYGLNCDFKIVIIVTALEITALACSGLSVSLKVDFFIPG